jgi:hypothetical protein
VRAAATDVAAILQKSRAALNAQNYLEATAAVNGLPEQIRAHIASVEEATASRTTRRPPRRR